MSAAAEPKRLGKPVSFEDLYPGRFLKANDLKGQKVTVTIAAVDLEELEGDGGKTTKGVISFQGKEKMMALNRTNGLCLKAMFGKKVQEWIGKRVTLFPTEVQFGREMEDAIRIYGSPDIAKDMEIEIKLPKKRPAKMIMHRTSKSAAAPQAQQSGPAAATATTPAATPADPKTWTTTLAGAPREQLENAWRDCTEAFGGMPPLECEAAYQTRREQLSEENL